MTIEAIARVADIELKPLAVDAVAYRRRVIFECFKWDPQVGDASTISDHACVLSAATAERLSNLAESLAAETIELEQALNKRPDLYATLGLPRRLRRVLAQPLPPREASIRFMRFDFHPTEDGWAVSEVNSDVPGGFAEASALPRLAMNHLAGTGPGPDVAAQLVEAMKARTPPPGRIAFVHATAFSDDRQVMEFLASRFNAAGYTSLLAAPDHVCWGDGRAHSVVEGQAGPIDGIVRFFPAEWITALPRASEWRNYFAARTPSANPPHALLTQSKRLPLLWRELGVDVPIWRSVQPETRDPRDAPWRHDADWVLKPAFGRVGDSIGWRGGVPQKDWRRMALSATLFPRQWAAQRRFVPRLMPTRAGPRNICVGVFTIDGRAAGFYGRVSSRSTIEKHAEDIPVLIAGARHAD